MSVIALIQAEVNQKLSQKISSEKINLEGKSFARFGDKDHCWGIGHEWIFNHKKYWIYKFGSWRTAEKYAVESWTGQQTQGFWKKLASEIVEIETRVDTETVEKNKSCIDKWKPIFDSARPATENHPYLERKKVKPYTARVSSLDGSLLIPIEDVHGFVGVQIIRPDGSKIFSTGIKKRGSFVALSDFKEAPLVYVSEGFATAATIQEAFPDVPSIACLDCGNMTAAILSIREINPKCRIIIAADDDESKAGEDAASKVVKNKKIPRVTYRLPKFPYKAKEMTDFNDLACAYGIDDVVKQLSVTEVDLVTIIPLGHDGDTYFYTSSENKQIVKITSRNHDEKGFIRLVSSLKYWSEKYGYIDANEKEKINWSQARSDLIGQCHAIGIFDESNVRGIGIWDDEGTIVIHDGEQTKNLNHTSKFVYPKKAYKNLEMVPSEEDILGKIFDDFFWHISTKNQASKAYLAAWYVQSFIFTLMPWRFHIWITGPRGSGKSTVLGFLNDIGLFTRGFKNSTFSGISSECGQDQTAIIYDEAEATDPKTKVLIDFARQMTNHSEFGQVRGTATGSSRKIDSHVVFAFGSIQDGIVNAADKSRFFSVQLEVVKKKDKKDDDTNNDNGVDIFKEMGRTVRLAKKRKHEIWWHIVNQVPAMKKYFEFAREKLFNDFKSIDQRQADQIGACMACLLPFQVKVGNSISESTMTYMYECAIGLLEINSNTNEYLQESEEKETESAFQDLCSTIIDKPSNSTIGFYIAQILQGNESEALTSGYRQHLESFGLKIIKGSLFVAIKNKNLFAACKDYPRLAKLLQQDDELFLRKGTAKISGVDTKGIFVSLEKFNF